MLRSTTLLILAAALVQTACATTGSADGKKADFQDSVLSNANHAPAVLTPPDYDDAKTPMVDQVQKSSQADYHFTMGEALSFEGQYEKAIEEFKLTLDLRF